MSSLVVRVLPGWCAPYETDAADYLQPYAYTHDCGRIEETQAIADANRRAIGKLLALLVEKHTLTFSEAESVAGVSNGTLI